MKYNNLEELKRKKALLQNEVSEMESLITFNNPKESLSVLTNGFTDNFLSEKILPTGETKLSIKTGNIAKELGNTLMNKTRDNSLVDFDHSGLEREVVTNTFRIGGQSLAQNSVSYIRNLALSNIKSKNWKNKLIGLALVYVLPIVLKKVRKELEAYQRRESLSSMHKII